LRRRVETCQEGVEGIGTDADQCLLEQCILGGLSDGIEDEVGASSSRTSRAFDQTPFLGPDADAERRALGSIALRWNAWRFPSWLYTSKCATTLSLQIARKRRQG
jgi:hypothetical protein